ncbi:M48 family metalloprotease [Streptomyces sp. QTS52]
MTQPPSSPPEHPEQTASQQPPQYPGRPTPPYPQAEQQPPRYPNPAQQPRSPRSAEPRTYPDATQPPPHLAQPPTSPGATQPPRYPSTAEPPTAPGTTQPPAYPGPTQPPRYPSTAEPPTAPGTTQPPAYPGPTQEPRYPGSAEPPPSPGANQPSSYSAPTQPPAYPDSAAPPEYPGSAQPPTHPGAAQQPQYPNSAQPPAYPGGTPTQPQPQSQPPAYPGPTPNQPPTHPQATAQVIPPQYAPPRQPPTTPTTPLTPPAESPTSPPPPAPAAAHPHHIPTDRRRVHISAHQRRTDATAVGNLLLYLPNFLCSLLVVSMFSLFFGDLAFLVIIAWILSGALVFHRPTESALARRLLHLRYPTPQERAKLEPVWREVTARAGVEGRNYELWVEDSDGLNAVAAAGHIVGVTRFAMNELPNGELAAVMAHELGHHVGGHAWSGLLGYWYAQPGRLAWRFLRAFSVIVFRVSRAFSCFGVAFVVLVLGGIAMATISTLYGLPLLILGVPYALAAVGRRAELRADEHAAALGFAPMLASVLDKLHQEEQRQTAALAALNNGVAPEESPLSKLLSSHPDHHTRLHHLQPYLQQQR